jgi:hypothetical protein
MDQEQSDEDSTAGIDELEPTKLNKEEKRFSSPSTVQAALAPPIAVHVKNDKGKATAGAGGELARPPFFSDTLMIHF